MPPRGNRSAIAIPMRTKEMHAMLIAHFLCTSTMYRSARRSASFARSRARDTSARLLSLTGGCNGLAASGAVDDEPAETAGAGFFTTRDGGFGGRWLLRGRRFDLR